MKNRLKYDPELPPAFLLAGRLEHVSADNDIRVVLDTAEIEFYIEIAPMAAPSKIEGYLDYCVFGLGFELIEEDECPVEITEDGWTRLYLVPIEPIDDMAEDEAIKVPRVLRVATTPGAIVGSILSGLGVAACFALHHPSTQTATTALMEVLN